MALKVIQIGAGGFGEWWCRYFLPPNIKDGTVEIVGLVDANGDALEKGRSLLGLSRSSCFTELEEAFNRTKADFCTIVIPPAFHERVVDLAIKKGVHILSEKPIADTLEACIRIAEKVGKSGLKMAVTMSHRYDQDKQTFAQIVRSNHLGPLSSLFCNISQDFRKYGIWRPFRHEMQDPLLIENAVHQLDILASLVDAPCKTIFANSWRPAWAEFKGDTDAVVVMEFANGTRATLTGSVSAAVGLADVPFEEFRADGRDGIALLQQKRVEIFRRIDWGAPHRNTSQNGSGMYVKPLPGEKWANALLVEMFAAWVNGGAPMETNVANNLVSNAIVFAAIESARTQTVVEFPRFLEKHAIS